MIYLGLKSEQITAIYNNGGFKDNDSYSLIFSDDGIDIIINFKNMGQLKTFMKILLNVNENSIELERIKSFIDPDKRKDE